MSALACWVCKLGPANVYGGHGCKACVERMLHGQGHTGHQHRAQHPHGCCYCACPGYDGVIERFGAAAPRRAVVLAKRETTEGVDVAPGLLVVEHARFVIQRDLRATEHHPRTRARGAPWPTMS